MKTLLTLLLLTTIAQAQTVISFHYGTSNTLGAELLTPVNDNFSIGGGFGGVLTQDRYSGKAEKWCDLYAVSSFGYIGNVMIKEKAGLSVYCKDGKSVTYRPMVGIGAMYAISKDYGLEAGCDSFNGVTIGFCVIF